LKPVVAAGGTWGRLPLRWRFLALAARRGKLSARKLSNLARNYAAYHLRRERAGEYPSILIPELTNRCNLDCLNCREPGAGIVDYLGPGRPPVPLGSMRLDLYEAMLEEVGSRLLAVVLYVSGESLLHRDLFRMVERASELKVPSVLSTNGMLLDAEASRRLLGAGLDCLKVVVSGFSQETYGRVHRGGDIEVVRRNLVSLAEARSKAGSDAILVMDYLRFPHNAREEAEARRFCREIGIDFGIRVGFTAATESGGKGTPAAVGAVPSGKPCDWLWTIMTVGWDGRVLPCGNYAFTGDPETLGDAGGPGAVRGAWNGPRFRRFRSAHLRSGRGVYPLCGKCHYGGIRFQY
jgi:MoaA/NifB/PqqE/SkfB family radical SAM enzyme